MLAITIGSAAAARPTMLGAAIAAAAFVTNVLRFIFMARLQVALSRAKCMPFCCAGNVKALKKEKHCRRAYWAGSARFHAGRSTSDSDDVLHMFHAKWPLFCSLWAGAQAIAPWFPVTVDRDHFLPVAVRKIRCSRIADAM
jgi:hypothetical protein